MPASSGPSGDAQGILAVSRTSERGSPETISLHLNLCGIRRAVCFTPGPASSDNPAGANRTDVPACARWVVLQEYGLSLVLMSRPAARYVAVNTDGHASRSGHASCSVWLCLIVIGMSRCRTQSWPVRTIR